MARCSECDLRRSRRPKQQLMANSNTHGRSSSDEGDERPTNPPDITSGVHGTASGPTHPSPTDDPVAQQALQTEALVASIPENSNKPGEFGRDSAIAPPT